MIYFFEGHRNSGKSFLSDHLSAFLAIPKFQYSFVDWFRFLSMDSGDNSTHKFALGKESMLLQLNNDGAISDLIVDRGVFSVLSWGVLENRISKDDALKQLDFFYSSGLLNKCVFFKIRGKNPRGNRQKDEWDDSRSSEEGLVLDWLFGHCSEKYPSLNVFEVENQFNQDSVNLLKKISKKI